MDWLGDLRHNCSLSGSYDCRDRSLCDKGGVKEKKWRQRQNSGGSRHLVII